MVMTAGSLAITNGGQISTSTLGPGAAGNVSAPQAIRQ
jgi:hypothetical protein